LVDCNSLVAVPLIVVAVVIAKETRTGGFLTLLLQIAKPAIIGYLDNDMLNSSYERREKIGLGNIEKEEGFRALLKHKALTKLAMRMEHSLDSR
jgi:hypothetical protein